MRDWKHGVKVCDLMVIHLVLLHKEEGSTENGVKNKVAHNQVM